MRNLGKLWEDCQKGIVSNGEWEYEHLLIIDKLEYHNDSILAINFNRELIYESFGLGNCIASQLNATLIQRPDYDIYRGSKVVLKTRIITLKEGNSDWIDFGTFYVAKNTKEDDKVKLECFDKLMDSDIPFYDGTEQDIVWPLQCTEVMLKVCKRLSIELDHRTNINNSYFVDDPGKMTIRQVLSYIGIMNCGNWYITEENKLRLVIVKNQSDIPLAEIDESMAKKIMTLGTSSFDGVQITYGKGDEDIIQVGGKNSVLRLFVPWVTKSIATDIYNTIKDYKYNAFEVQSVEIDPAIELGDQISINGVQTNVFSLEYSQRMYANIIMPPTTIDKEESFANSDVSVSGTINENSIEMFWDFNTKVLNISTSETQIGLIDIDVLSGGYGKGQLNLSFISHIESEIVIRIYDNNTEQLYSPITKRVHKGPNQIGIPHQYLRLLSGSHEFTVTAQMKSGEVFIGVRDMMYSIEMHALNIAPIEAGIRDITLRQPEGALEPTDVYLIAKHENEHPVILRTRYIDGRNYSGNDFNILWEMPELLVKELAIEFDGIFTLLVGQELDSLVTQDKPWIFWTDRTDVLWGQYGDEINSKIKLAEEVLQISACRGWNSSSFKDEDMGLIIAYLKYNGIIAYRQLVGIAKNQPIWNEENILEEAGQNNLRVNVSRLNDYRIAFTVEGINKIFVTDRTYVGQAMPTETISAKINFGGGCKNEVLFSAIPTSQLPLVFDLLSGINEENNHVTVICNYDWEITSCFDVQKAFIIKEQIGDGIFKNCYIDASNPKLLHIEFMESVTGRMVVDFNPGMVRSRLCCGGTLIQLPGDFELYFIKLTGYCSETISTDISFNIGFEPKALKEAYVLYPESETISTDISFDIGFEPKALKEVYVLYPESETISTDISFDINFTPLFVGVIPV